jgi:hypothetical protein
LKSLDALNYTLQGRGVAGLKRKACIDVEGTNGGEVAFNVFVEDGTLLAGEMSCPGHETDFGGWKELARGESILQVEPDKIEE